MPKVVSRDEKKLKKQYEFFIGKAVSTSNWCFIKSKIKKLNLDLCPESLLKYRITYAASGKSILSSVSPDVESLIFSEINNFYKANEQTGVTGETLHMFCKVLVAKYTTKKHFYREQIKRLFQKATSEHSRTTKNPELIFGYRITYSMIDLQPFFSFFQAWCKRYLLEVKATQIERL